MPNIIFVSNNSAHWINSVTTTEADTFDSTRVPYALELANQELIVSPEFIPATGDVTWIHFRCYMDGLQNTDTVLLLKAWDTVGKPIFAINKIYNSALYLTELKLYDGAGGDNTDLQTFSFNKSRINNVDMKITMTASSMQVDMYVNGGIAATISQASNPDSVGNPAYFTLGACFTTSSGQMQFSEIIVADGDTRYGRMNLIRPTASGGETSWVGPAANMADDDNTSGMTSIAAGERQTFTLEAYTGASNVSAVVVATMSVAGVGAPQNMRHLVRMSTVNYESPADIALGDVLKYSLTDYQINPGTSVPWISANIASMEMGFISKT